MMIVTSLKWKMEGGSGWVSCLWLEFGSYLDLLLIKVNLPKMHTKMASLFLKNLSKHAKPQKIINTIFFPFQNWLKIYYLQIFFHFYSKLIVPSRSRRCRGVFGAVFERIGRKEKEERREEISCFLFLFLFIFFVLVFVYFYLFLFIFFFYLFLFIFIYFFLKFI